MSIALLCVTGVYLLVNTLVLIYELYKEIKKHFRLREEGKRSLRQKKHQLKWSKVHPYSPKKKTTPNKKKMTKGKHHRHHQAF